MVSYRRHTYQMPVRVMDLGAEPQPRGFLGLSSPTKPVRGERRVVLFVHHRVAVAVPGDPPRELNGFRQTSSHATPPE